MKPPFIHELVLGLSGRSYPITIGYNFLGSLNEVCPFIAGRNAVIISNSTVSDLYLSLVTSSLDQTNSNYIVINLPEGEQAKKLSNVELIVSKMLENFNGREAGREIVGRRNCSAYKKREEGEGKRQGEK